MFSTVVADLKSHVSPNYSGVAFWGRVLGKALFAPAVHVVLLYRLSSLLYRNVLTRPLAFVVRSIEIVWGGTEIHPSARIGPGLCLVHSQKVLIGPGVRIGSNVRMSHGVSIGGDQGRNAPATGIPVVGDNVTIALDSIILGGVVVGDDAVISAQSLVVRDVPPGGVVAGSPARLVRRRDDVEVSGPGGV